MKRKKILPYNPILKELARGLRANSTLSEVLLWKHLNGRQMLGYDFDRQKPIDNFIVDFFCSELMLAIEIDGDTHNYKAAQDDERQRRLEAFGIRFQRFADRDVKRNMEGVISVIQNWIKDKTHPCTPPEEGNPPLHPSQEGTKMTKESLHSALRIHRKRNR
jgi:very-short-patch-repair endonuclease